MEETTTTSRSTVDPVNMYSYLNSLFNNPAALIILVVVILIYILFFSSLGNSNNQVSQDTSTQNTSWFSLNKIIIGLVLFVIIIVILFNVFEYFFGIDITSSISNLFSSEKRELQFVLNEQTTEPTLPDSSNNNTFSISYNKPGSEENHKLNKGKSDEDDNENSDDHQKRDDGTPDYSNESQGINEIRGGKQVFNIPGNVYNYQDANAICKAYGSRLASYNEIENSYNKGAEWCNYGWSADQMALFPTQKNTYDKLRKIKGHEHDCGRPGVNGGYIANPNVKFGVNCYGYKPEINSVEKEMMQNTSPYPKTEKDLQLEKQVEHWKQRIDQVLVSPFNYDTWSKY